MQFNDLKALEAILKTLEPLTEEERVRVLRWAVEKLGIENVECARDKRRCEKTYVR